jgi:glycosyltransferase involved in cell wall biosynthesis
VIKEDFNLGKGRHTLSVIIPCYNEVITLQRSITSVMKHR